MSALLVGPGVFFFPVSFALPFHIINWIDLRSKTLRFGCIFVPLLVPLKCLDALFGVDSADRRLRMRSLRYYLYYMGFLLVPKYTDKDDDDERAIGLPLTMRALLRAHNGYLGWLLVSIR